MNQKAEKAKPSKRIYLINRDFQLRYAGAAVFVGLITTILTAFVVLYPLYIFEILRVPRFVPVPFLVAMLIALVLNIFLVAFMGVVLTHKIAGPIYSLVRNFRRIEQGRWNSYLKLRQDDEMQYLARKYNDMIDALRARGVRDLEALTRVKEGLSKLPGNNPIGKEIEDMIAELNGRVYATETPRSEDE
ncbi:MAG: hypothetical protein AB7T49_16440 [Oligoflexales bacterium]